VTQLQSIPRDPLESAWARWFAGRPGIGIAFLWGLAEATFFFVIPDVFLSFVAIFGGRRTWLHILAAIAGALAGGALMFEWAQSNPDQAHRAVARVPFIREKMFESVDNGLRTHGLPAVFLGSIAGIPYKLYAVEAPKFSTARDFLLATPPARAPRFLAVWLVFGGVAAWLRKRGNWQGPRLVRLHAAVWMVLYAFYWASIVFR
jgi:membrane protein YqaA with SNARE-associated domain